MAGIFLSIFVFSFLAAVICRFVFPQRFNNLETGCIFGVSLLFGGIMVLIISWAAMSDIDVLNGKITGKEMDRVSCSHSYECNCYTTTDSKGNSTRHCSTCYEHPFDQDWNVGSTVGGFTIDRVDRQGLIEPKRWSKVLIGEPASRTERVTNYVLASPHSLFNTQEFDNDQKNYGKWLPVYHETYDYYRYDHVYNMGVQLPEVNQYNDAVANLLRELGPSKQANVNVIFAPTDDREYKNALERHWLGGKKNDIIVVIGVKDYPKIGFADAFTFARSSHNEMLAVKLQQDIEAVGDVTKVADVVNVINTDVAKYFNREHMSKYEYLKEDYVPSGGTLIWTALFYLVVLIGMIVFFWINDVTLDGVSTNRFRSGGSAYMPRIDKSRFPSNNNPYRRNR